MAVTHPGHGRAGLRPTINAFGAMVRKEFIIMTRYPVEFVASFLQLFLIVTLLTLAGLMFAPDGVQSREASTAGGIVVYGFVVFLYLTDTLWSISYNVRREQKQGTLEQLYLSPASKFANLAARVVLTLFWTGLLSLASAFLMRALLGRLPFENAGTGALVLLLTLSGTFGVGFAFAALTLRIKETAATVNNAIQFAFMVFCAPFFPFSVLPVPIQFISRLIPLSYGVDLFRSTMLGFPPGFPELAPIEVEWGIVIVFGLLMPWLGLALYRRAEDRARRSGSLAEY